MSNTNTKRYTNLYTLKLLTIIVTSFTVWGQLNFAWATVYFATLIALINTEPSA